MNKYDIGRRIEAYREKLKMSTQDLAERIHRSQATISRIENGKQGLTFELLSSIAAELRVHPFALLSDEPLRSSVLMPPNDDDGDYPPSLLANALHAGRLRRRFSLPTAAEMLAIPVTELESIELALSCPDDVLLTRFCELYGLEAEEMRFLKSFGDAVPETAKGLAYLQQLCSHLHYLILKTKAGEEAETLEKILHLLEAADWQCGLPLDSMADDVDLFLNRLSLHLVNALKGDGFLAMLKRVGAASGAAEPVSGDVGLVQADNGQA